MDRIENRILQIRGQRVLIDADLARFYGVPTKRLNEQVRRNRDRFPEDFMFRLSHEEKRQLVADCAQFHDLKHFRPSSERSGPRQLRPMYRIAVESGSNGSYPEGHLPSPTVICRS